MLVFGVTGYDRGEGLEMKIAYVDVELSGHHINYLETLFLANPESIAIVPEKLSCLPQERQFVISGTTELYKHPYMYLRWLSEIYHIARKEKIERIHFLYGDAFVRFFGVGLLKFRKYRLLVTFHQIRRHWLKDISLRWIFKRIDTGIVHTRKLKEHFCAMGIKNVEHIEYPCFSNPYREGASERIREGLCIKDNVPILLLIGMVNRCKGLEILIKALSGIEEDYHLIVSGYNQEFSGAEIEAYKRQLGRKVTFELHYLTDDEYGEYLSACNIVMLPYKKRFDGASGPLVDAVSLRKPVIAANHGSLGEIVKEHSLGLLFEAENVQSLRAAIRNALIEGIPWSEAAEQYRKFIISPEHFINAHKKLYER